MVSTTGLEHCLSATLSDCDLLPTGVICCSVLSISIIVEIRVLWNYLLAAHEQIQQYPLWKWEYCPKGASSMAVGNGSQEKRNLIYPLGDSLGMDVTYYCTSQYFLIAYMPSNPHSLCQLWICSQTLCHSVIASSYIHNHGNSLSNQLWTLVIRFPGFVYKTQSKTDEFFNKIPWAFYLQRDFFDCTHPLLYKSIFIPSPLVCGMCWTKQFFDILLFCRKSRKVEDR